jgi:hypothetical protein
MSSLRVSVAGSGERHFSINPRSFPTMRKYLLVAGLAAAALIPTLAAAQSECAEQRHDNRVAGTVIGAGLGALLGSAVAGHGDRTGGAVIGGVGGAVAGNAIGGAATNCRAYGYYDSNGVWHAEATADINPNGYYDRDGRWVAGAPSGYYATNGRWVPADARGYYDSDGHWMAVNGHFDASGRWVAYGQSGYYDRDGRWVYTTPSAAAQGADVVYSDRDIWSGAPMDISAREDWLDRRIRDAMRDDRIDRDDGRRALAGLADIRQDQARALRRHDGYLPADDRTELQARLDRLSRSINWREHQD